MRGSYIRIGTKGVTTRYHTIDVRQLKKVGYFSYPDAYVSFSYGDKHQTISITWTECNFGGFRPWFMCPARNCYKRSAILYLSNIFACRSCCNLAYPIENELHEWRYIIKSRKIRERLGWGPGAYIPKPVEAYKPKGMHWRTYNRLIMKYCNIQDSGMAPHIARMRAEQEQAEALCQSWIEQGL